MPSPDPAAWFALPPFWGAGSGQPIVRVDLRVAAGPGVVGAACAVLVVGWTLRAAKGARRVREAAVAELRRRIEAVSHDTVAQ